MLTVKPNEGVGGLKITQNYELSEEDIQKYISLIENYDNDDLLRLATMIEVYLETSKIGDSPAITKGQLTLLTNLASFYYILEMYDKSVSTYDRILTALLSVGDSSTTNALMTTEEYYALHIKYLNAKLSQVRNLKTNNKNTKIEECKSIHNHNVQLNTDITESNDTSIMIMERLYLAMDCGWLFYELGKYQESHIILTDCYTHCMLMVNKDASLAAVLNLKTTLTPNTTASELNEFLATLHYRTGVVCLHLGMMEDAKFALTLSTIRSKYVTGLCIPHVHLYLAIYNKHIKNENDAAKHLEHANKDVKCLITNGTLTKAAGDELMKTINNTYTTFKVPTTNTKIRQVSNKKSSTLYVDN